MTFFWNWLQTNKDQLQLILQGITLIVIVLTLLVYWLLLKATRRQIKMLKKSNADLMERQDKQVKTLEEQRDVLKDQIKQGKELNVFQNTLQVLQELSSERIKTAHNYLEQWRPHNLNEIRGFTIERALPAIELYELTALMMKEGRVQKDIVMELYFNPEVKPLMITVANVIKAKESRSNIAGYVINLKRLIYEMGATGEFPEVAQS